MIYQVSGNLITKYKDFVVLEVSGIGLKITATNNTIDAFKLKEKILLYTYLHVREDTQEGSPWYRMRITTARGKSSFFGPYRETKRPKAISSAKRSVTRPKKRPFSPARPR